MLCMGLCGCQSICCAYLAFLVSQKSRVKLDARYAGRDVDVHTYLSQIFRASSPHCVEKHSSYATLTTSATPRVRQRIVYAPRHYVVWASHGSLAHNAKWSSIFSAVIQCVLFEESCFHLLITQFRSFPNRSRKGYPGVRCGSASEQSQEGETGGVGGLVDGPLCQLQ